jgi:methylmalonyl-CoA mutase N-terminal domain/subunit
MNPTKTAFKNLSGIEIREIYTPDDPKDFDYQRDLNLPGQFPFTRGVYPTMYRGRLWTMRQFAGFASAKETNRRYRYLLANGTTGLSVAFDMPTLSIRWRTWKCSFATFPWIR